MNIDRTSADYNFGDNTVYTGGSMASHLLLPVIPAIKRDL